MITEMKKYTFLVLTSAYEHFLTELREAGVVHITPKAEGMADDPELQKLLARADEINRLLRQQSPDQLLNERAEVEQKIAATRKEAERMQIWGNFSSKRMQELREAGYTLRYYSCSKKAFQEEWGIPVAEVGSLVYFVTVNQAVDDEACTEQMLNEKSSAELLRDVENLNGLLVAANARGTIHHTRRRRQPQSVGGLLPRGPMCCIGCPSRYAGLLLCSRSAYRRRSDAYQTA